jgi:hypothetical protein
MDNKKIDVLVVLIDIGLTLENSAVFQSQVGEQINYLSRSGLSVGILCVIENKAKFNEIIGKNLESVGVQIFEIKSSNFFKNFYKIIRKGILITRVFTIKNLYARGIWGGLASIIINFLSFSKKDLTYDVRGHLEDELISVNVPLIKRKIYLLIESWCIKYAKNVTTVTSLLEKFVNTKFQQKNTQVIPCCVNHSDFHIPVDVLQQHRIKYGLKDTDIVFVYSGGLSHYQQVPQMLKLWSEFLEYPDIKYILLTNDDPHSHPVTIEFVKTFGNRLKHLSLKRYEVPLFLNVCDIAFLLRDGRLLNQAASPVKFAEYISSGLKVVTSPALGDVYKQVTKYDLGFLIHPKYSKDEIEELKLYIDSLRKLNRSEEKNRIKSVAYTLYDWSSYKEVFFKLYKPSDN